MLHLHALRVARARQLRARALRPLSRRRFPAGEPPREAAPVAAGEELWRSPAFAPSSPPEASTRLGRFHRQYGDDVLEAARAGDLAEARRLVATWIEAHPPRNGDAWHPYPLATRVGNWVASLTPLPALARPDGAPALFNDGTVDAPRLELPDPPEGLVVLPDSGFVVVREDPLWLAFRCGPSAPDFLPAHAHADALSFQLWWRGRPVVADPGTYTYEPGADRDWFRSTRAHSTVRVDDRDQFKLWGAFRSGRLPKVSLRYAREQAVEESVVLPGSIRQVRRIEWAG